MAQCRALPARPGPEMIVKRWIYMKTGSYQKHRDT